jgi:excisionase family DNA binding protein
VNDPNLQRLLTVEEVADRFRVSRRTLQAHIRRHPFYRLIGRRKLFTEDDVRKIYESLSCPSNSHADTAAPIGTCVAPSEASLWTKAQALLTEKSQKRSERNGNGS